MKIKKEDCCVSGSKLHLLECIFIAFMALLLLVSVVQAFQIAEVKKSVDGSKDSAVSSPAQAADDDMASHHSDSAGSSSSSPSMVGGC